VRDARGRFDWGRYDGIKTLQAGRFNLLSRYNDEASRANAISTRHVALDPEAYGAFKVPGLRNVALTGPYMHNGTLASLRDVVRHYSEIDDAKLAIAASSPHPEPTDLFERPPRGNVLQTLNFSETQVNDLVAFLETLTERKPLVQRPAPGAVACR
jgi:cytochrome c peroxidase